VIWDPPAPGTGNTARRTQLIEEVAVSLFVSFSFF
jgi:hypothetical protein